MPVKTKMLRSGNETKEPWVLQHVTRYRYGYISGVKKRFQKFKINAMFLIFLTIKNSAKPRVLAPEGFELPKTKLALMTDIPLGYAVSQCGKA